MGFKVSEKRVCPLCGDYLEDAPAEHNLVRCEKTELLKGREEIKKLKASVRFWNDAWYELREIIGNLWWHHPAIDNVEKRAYYQQAQREMKNASEV